jgi:hypothetical protein
VLIGPFAAPTGPVRWWEVAFQLIYFSHFVASFSVAAVLWVRKRTAFQAYARRLVTLSYLGFVTYVLFPAAPPWLAAAEGHLPPHIGRVGRGLDEIGLRLVGDLITEGAKTQNQVAAVPSLHLGFAALIVITLWRSVPPCWRPLLAAYPLSMGFVLVLNGEHYVVDLLLGFGYALGTHLAWNRIERWWGSRHPAERRRVDFGGERTPVDASGRAGAVSPWPLTGGAPAAAAPSPAGAGRDDRRPSPAGPAARET